MVRRLCVEEIMGPDPVSGFTTRVLDRRLSLAGEEIEGRVVGMASCGCDMNQELDRLLELGEPLLTVFPKADHSGWLLQLPANVSSDMRWYANLASLKKNNRHMYWKALQQFTTEELAKQAKICETGILGWRAIGVLT